MASGNPFAVVKTLGPVGRQRFTGASTAFACVATAALVARIAGDTLFLQAFGAELLPYLYIASSLLVASIASLIGVLARKVAVRHLIIGSATGLAAFAVAVRLALPVAPSPARIVAGLFADLVVNLPAALFWGLSGTLFNPREAKRVLGLVGVAGTVGCILGGLWVRPFARAFGAENLLLVVAVLLVGYALAVAFLIEAPPAAAPVARGSAGPPALDGAAQVRAVALLVVASAVALTLADYLFKAVARQSFAPAELAGFFGLFYAGANAAALVVQLLFVHRILAAGGLLAGLLVLPVTLVTLAPLVLATGSFLWVCAARASFAVFGLTIDSSAVQLASLAIKKQTRPRARAIIDGVYKPAAVALTATAIIALHSWAPRLVVPGALLAVGLLWAGAAVYARRAYVSGLLDSIERETLDFSEEELAGAFGRDFQQSLADRLATASDADLPYLIGLIGEQQGVSYAPAARALLGRDSPDIRKAVVEYLGRHGESSDLPAILPLLADHDDGVRQAALEAVAVLGGRRAVGALEASLTDPHPRIRAEAAAVLAEHGDLEGILAGSSALKTMLGSDDPEVRGVAVGALGRMRRGSIWKVVRSLMQDTDATVRRAAIEAARSHPEPEIVDALFTALDDPEVAGTAEEVLVGFGPKLAEMTAAWQQGRDGRVPPRVPALLARVGAPEAMPLLLDLAERGPRGVRDEAVTAIVSLSRSRALEPLAAERLARLAQAESEGAQRIRRQLVTLRGLPGSDALEFALREEMLARFRNIAHLASALAPAFEPAPICQAAEDGDLEEKAAAAEVADNVLPERLRRLLVPLLEKDPERSAAEDPSAELAAILAEPSSDWVLSGALYAAAQGGRRELAALVARSCTHPSPMVRETALFALRDLGDEDRLAELAPRLADDASPAVSSFARSLLATAAGGPR